MKSLSAKRVRPAVAAAAIGLIAAGATAASASAAQVKYRVNAGGPVIMVDGVPWAVDSTATPSPFVNAADDNRIFTTDAPIDISDPTIPAGTPMELFQSERWDTNRPPALVWTFPAEPGVDYLVRLYFGEAWDQALAPGARVFNVSVEGKQVLANFDQYVATGANGGTARSFRVNAADITDGNIQIVLDKVVQNPSIKGIEILALAPGEDVDAPDTTIADGPSATRHTKPRFAFTASEQGTTFSCRMDLGSWAPCASGQAFGPLARGQHLLRVRAIDAAGNADQSEAERAFAVDRTKPRVTRTSLSRKVVRVSPRGGTLSKSLKSKYGTVLKYKLSEDAKATVTVEKRRGHRYVRLQGSATKSGDKGTNRIRFTGRLKGKRLTAGSYRLRVSVADAAGNKAKMKRLRFRVR